MASNLRDRLRRLQEIKASEKSTFVSRDTAPSDSVPVDPAFAGWVSAGYQTLVKTFDLPSPLSSAAFPDALPIVIPDMYKCVAVPKKPTDLLFFDLETTGLGGAGTLAFLAAFGRHIPAKNVLRITQYLLLDYPGENDFLEAVLAEFSGDPLVVTYNGKSFDSQIINQRCLINGIHPVDYIHADLLHPARRLWKRLIESCSQGNIEEKILGLDRTGDIPGALAPDIWFDFLRTPNTATAAALMGICEHNRRDITGLAGIFAAMITIATEPIAACKRYDYDTELVALRWRDTFRRGLLYHLSEKKHAAVRQMGKELLCHAADSGSKAALAYALDLLWDKSNETSVAEGRKRLSSLASAKKHPIETRAAALRALAIDAERQQKNIEKALKFAQLGLEMTAADEKNLSECFKRRIERLEKKLNT